MVRLPYLPDPAFCPIKNRRAIGLTVGSGLALILAASLSCGEKPEQSRTDLTISEANTVFFMRAPIERGYDAVRDAQQSLNRERPDVVAARTSLQVAEKALAEVSLYYMPATQARGQILNAYREQIAGRSDERDRYLADARKELDGIMRRCGPELERSTKELSEMIDRIAMRLRLGESVNEEMEALIEQFDLHLSKAPLILGSESFREREK